MSGEIADWMWNFAKCMTEKGIRKKQLIDKRFKAE